MAEESTVRENLMTRPGYRPYCGNVRCPKGMPRTHLINGQFQCACGWRSQFPADFMGRYLTKRADTPNGQ